MPRETWLVLEEACADYPDSCKRHPHQEAGGLADNDVIESSQESLYDRLEACRWFWDNQYGFRRIRAIIQCLFYSIHVKEKQHLPNYTNYAFSENVIWRKEMKKMLLTTMRLLLLPKCMDDLLVEEEADNEAITGKEEYATFMISQSSPLPT